MAMKSRPSASLAKRRRVFVPMRATPSDFSRADGFVETGGMESLGIGAEYSEAGAMCARLSRGFRAVFA